MSSQGLEEFDVEKELKKDEEPIVLSEKEDDFDDDATNYDDATNDDDVDDDDTDNVADDDVESKSGEIPQISINTEIL